MNLQTAIDNAGAGATLAVLGTCSGNYTINTNLTLLGQGRAVLDGQHGGTTLTISSGVTVRLGSLTITDGNASGAGVGGGINNSGTLTLEQTTVTHNSAGDYGGGIYNNSSAALTLKDSTISGNSSSVFGGGIFVFSGTVPLNNSIVSSNIPDNCDPPGSVDGCTG